MLEFILVRSLLLALIEIIDKTERTIDGLAWLNTNKNG